MKSEGSEIYTQYKENEHVRIAFVIEKRSGNKLLSIFINGTQNGAVRYTDNDNFSCAPAISIGSNECTIDIYNIRIYNNDLTRYQVLNNWIADTQDADLMLERYTRNDVFDDYGQIVINKLPANLPYMILECPELPQSKGDKKTIQITYVDPFNPSRSFTATDAQGDVQGTSSQGYPRKNYKIKFKNGVTLYDGTNAENWPLREDAISTDTFCLKADYASSEGANNVELARLYNEICPYKTPPQVADSRVRQGIDGFPIVVFWRNSNDGSTIFIGKYNFNNDKGTAEIFGFSDGDESWESKNNTGNRSLFKSADFSGTDWQEDFEARYPEDNTDPSNLAELAVWLVSTDRSAVSSAEEKAARLQKFREELPQYMEVNAVIFYYIFTELFLMVDSRAKNAFWTAYRSKNGKWFSLPYDFDTALGINNEGALVFGYHLEDIDKTDSGAGIFNGQDSVLWVNLRDAYADEIRAMYQSLRRGALSYEKVERMFEDHQNIWPEAIFNEDSYFKYIAPLSNGIDNLSMLQGSKTEQRKWWLYNRFRYLDSKYNTGDTLSDFIELRGYEKSDIQITPYADVYASVKYAQTTVQKRALRGSSQTLECPLDNVNDTEIYIYSASQLADVGDLSGLKVGRAIFSSAVRLQRLKLGDASENYRNGNLQTLTLGNNTLLKSLDVRNCNGLTGNIDVSGCTNIEEIYFDGTEITGVTLPNGGGLKKLSLPGSITSLIILNQTKITELSIPDYSRITTLRLENCGKILDSLSILQQMPDESRVRILGVNWSVADGLALLEKLDKMDGLTENNFNTDTAQISGTLHAERISAAALSEYQNKYPNLNVTYDELCNTVYYYNYDGSELLYRELIPFENPSATYSGRPEKSPTKSAIYTFAGWSTQKNSQTADAVLTNITADKTVYAAYTESPRTYVVTYYNGEKMLYRVSNVAYGTDAVYPGNTSDLQSPNPLEEGFMFSKWNPEPANITEDLNCYAEFELPENITDTWDQIIASCADGTYKTKYKIGDMKVIDLGVLGKNVMQIAAIDKEPLADGSGNAHISWISRYLISGHRMNSAENMTAWDQSEMRDWLGREVWTCISSNLRAAILSVNKSHTAYDSAGSSFTQTTADSIWIPAYTEIFNSGYYSSLLSSNPKKRRLNSAENSIWWLRSEFNTAMFNLILGDDKTWDPQLQGNGATPYVIVAKIPKEVSETAILKMYFGDAMSVDSFNFKRSDTNADVQLYAGNANWNLDGNTLTVNAYSLVYTAKSWWIIFNNGRTVSFDLLKSILAESAAVTHDVAFGFCL